MLQLTPIKKKDRNKQRLIDATLEALVQFGYADASISKIIQIAGLSRGMVHLHFENKDALLAAAAEKASDDYYAGLEHWLNSVPTTVKKRIEAIIEYDLSTDALNEKNICTLYELRGAARTRPSIEQFTGTRDTRLEAIYADALSEMGDDKELIQDAIYGTISLLEGIWINFMLNPVDFDRDGARRIIFRFLSGLFPAQLMLQN
jgi:TetR/AcrR family transcriptional repressor of bet genes